MLSVSQDIEGCEAAPRTLRELVARAEAQLKELPHNSNKRIVLLQKIAILVKLMREFTSFVRHEEGIVSKRSIFGNAVVANEANLRRHMMKLGRTATTMHQGLIARRERVWNTLKQRVASCICIF